MRQLKYLFGCADYVVCNYFGHFIVFMVGALSALGGMSVVLEIQRDLFWKSRSSQVAVDPVTYDRLQRDDIDSLFRQLGKADSNPAWHSEYVNSTWRAVGYRIDGQSAKRSREWLNANQWLLVDQYLVAANSLTYYAPKADTKPVFSRDSWDTLYRMELVRCPEVGVLLESIWYEDYLNRQYDEYLETTRRLKLSESQQRGLFLHNSGELYAFRQAIKQHPACPKNYTVNPVGDAMVKSVLNTMGL